MAARREERRRGPLKEWLERFEDEGDLRSYPIQRVDGVPVVVDRYVRREVGAQVHIGIWSGRGDLDANYFVASLQDAEAAEHDEAGVACGDAIAVVLGAGYLDNCLIRGSKHRVEDAVLVDVGQGGEGFEGVEFAWRHTVVRLQQFSLRCMGRVNVAKVGMVFPPRRVSQERGLGEDRELDLFGLVFRWITPEMLDRNLPPQVIKGATEVVECVPDEKPPSVADLRDALDAVDDGPLFRLIASVEGYRLQLTSGGFGNLVAKRVYVGLRAFEFCPGSV